MLDLVHPDDIPVLTEAQSKMTDLIILHRGWKFYFSYGLLLNAYPL